MRGTDLVSCEQALFEAYRKTGDFAAAQAIVDQGIRHAGTFASAYREMGRLLARPESHTPP